jgi:hypothetical protein
VAEQYGIQVYAIVLVKAGSIPKTSSGKIQRYASRSGFLTQTLDVVSAWQAPITPESNDPVATSAAGCASQAADNHKKELLKALLLRRSKGASLHNCAA